MEALAMVAEMLLLLKGKGRLWGIIFFSHSSYFCL